jgi:hypothetical protein
MPLPIPDRTVFDDVGCEPMDVSPCQAMTPEQIMGEIAALKMQLAVLNERIMAYERRNGSDGRGG